VFFFLFFCLRRKKCQGKNIRNKRVETRGQKWEPKVRRQNKSLKVSSFPSLHFFSSLWFFSFFFFFFLLLEKKKMQVENVWNKRVEAITKNERVEWELKGKFLPYYTFFFFFMVFFFVFLFFSFAWKEEMLGENIWNKRAKVGGQKQEPKMRVEQELEGKLLPFSTFFFFSMVFFFLLLFFLLEKKMPRKNIWNTRA